MLGGDSEALWISKGEVKIVFDLKVKTPKGAIFAAYFKRNSTKENKVAAVMQDKVKKVLADVVHDLLGHMNKRSSSRKLAWL